MRHFLTFFLLVLLEMLGDVWSCRTVSLQTNQITEEPRIAEINTAGIGGSASGCRAGWKYSAGKGKCVWCNEEENFHWSEFRGRCLKFITSGSKR